VLEPAGEAADFANLIAFGCLGGIEPKRGGPGAVEVKRDARLGRVLAQVAVVEGLDAAGLERGVVLMDDGGQVRRAGVDQVVGQGRIGDLGVSSISFVWRMSAAKGAATGAAAVPSTASRLAGTSSVTVWASSGRAPARVRIRNRVWGWV
jgi:hypothetical protein